MNSDEWNKDFLRCTESSSVGLCWRLAAESLISLYSQRDARQRVNSPTALDESLCCKNEVRGWSLMGLKRSVTSSLDIRRPTQRTCGSLSPQSDIILLFIFPGSGFCALHNSQIPQPSLESETKTTLIHHLLPPSKNRRERERRAGLSRDEARGPLSWNAAARGCWFSSSPLFLFLIIFLK